MRDVHVISLKDDLAAIADAINAASWDDANDLSRYDAEALRYYLRQADNIFMVCFDGSGNGRTLLGIASARIQYKPYDRERWLYVDEVDVCVDQRQKGAGTAMMRKLLDMARAAFCTEVWLGTEIDNAPANALYRSLKPDEVERFVGYAYEIEES